MIKLTRREVLWSGAGGAIAATGFGAGRTLHRVWVGTFTNASGETIPGDFGQRTGVSRGLYSFPFDAATGRAGEMSLAIEMSNPTNLILHSNRRVVYACRGQNTRIDGQNLISALAVQGDRLIELNTVQSGGLGPTVGVVDRAGRFLLTTNFNSSSVVCFRLNRDGSLLERTAYIGPPFVARSSTATPVGAPGYVPSAAEIAAGRTKPHAIVLTRSERYAISAEIDGNRCTVMRFDRNSGTLAVHSQASAGAGAGPRQLMFGNGDRFLYTSNELSPSITVWRWDERSGTLTPIQQLSSLPTGYTGSDHPADVQVHPSGRFVYVTNRTAGTVAAWRIDARTGLLSRIADAPIGSPSSWSLAFDPSGRWAFIAAQMGDYVDIHAVDRNTGALTPTGQRLAVTLPTSLRIS